MSELKRTQLYDTHVAAGATMVDFGGWEMPIQYPAGIIAEHLYTRRFCSLFDVSHMGRLIIEGADTVAFLQRVLTSNVAGLAFQRAQYCIIPAADGTAIDDAYLYRFDPEKYLLVVNASNTEKDLMHLTAAIAGYNCSITNITGEMAAIALQGSQSTALLETLSGGTPITEDKKNACATVTLEGRTVYASRTGYTGEPLGYELYIASEDVAWLWERLCELGARPAGLGARDTLRLEASMPLYGHEMGVDPDGNAMPIFAVPLAKFAVSFLPEKGDFIGRDALAAQYDAFCRIKEGDYSALAALPKSIRPITLVDRGVMRAGMPVYRGEEQVGWVTSGTMVPYYLFDGDAISEDTGKRSIGLAYIASDVTAGDTVEVDIRGRRIRAAIPTRHMRADQPPYVRAVIHSN